MQYTNLKEMNEDLVPIRVGSRMFIGCLSNREWVAPYSNARLSYMNCIEEREVRKYDRRSNPHCFDDEPSTIVSAKRIGLFKEWYKENKWNALQGRIYQPCRRDETRILDGTDHEWKGAWNDYCAPLWPLTKKRDLVRPFLKLVVDLMGKENAKWFVTWLAKIVQDPATKTKIAPALLNLSQYDDHVYILLGIISCLVGPGNYENTKLEGISPRRSDGGYDKLLTRVELFGDEDKKSIETIKELVICDRHVRLKASKCEDVYNNLIFTAYKAKALKPFQNIDHVKIIKVNIPEDIEAIYSKCSKKLYAQLYSYLLDFRA